jgi:hypothetical protein
MSNLIDRIETFWCRHMHDATMWPIHGRYRCGTCLREYPVAFEGQAEIEPLPLTASDALAT